ncbi:MAG: hypothetical protein M8352_02785 [ANME-2 cluster archaeon]|nr:hypothetical protein [ANME-2 cluster archaeon]MDF1532648.1 hypothetical protein [ANME-2 cluster archaeon]
MTSTLLAILILVCIIAVVTVLVVYSGQPGTHDGSYLKVDGQQAVEIVTQDPVAQQYLSENFKRPEWRVVKTTLVNDSSHDLNGSIIQEDEPYWKVEMMERTCSCSTVKDLFVVEGHVSTQTGELMNLTTGQVIESQYDKQTCTSTICH